VFALNAENVALTGGGTFDGQQPLYIESFNATETEFTPLVRVCDCV
jgi:hypothetical protein